MYQRRTILVIAFSCGFKPFVITFVETDSDFPAYRISGNTFRVDNGLASLIDVSAFALSGKLAMRHVKYRSRACRCYR